MNPTSNAALRILLYNYVQPWERGSPGGGVSVYLRNLHKALRDAGHTVYVLSAGDRYTWLRRKPRLRRLNQYNFVVYNSPVVAPASFSFYHPDIYLSDDSLREIPNKLREELQQIDIFHFHNIEGLTVKFIRQLRRAFPISAFLFSIHNYNIGCPQVNLWQDNVRACQDYKDGLACVTCLPFGDRRGSKLIANRIKTPVKDLDTKIAPIINSIYKLYFVAKHTLSKIGSKSNAQNTALYSSNRTSSDRRNIAALESGRAVLYRRYREDGAKLMNEVFDRNLAVSERVRELVIKFGADPSKVAVCYIGSRFADKFELCAKKKPSRDEVHIAYLGYMRRDKGFEFFLHSLEKLVPSVRRKLSVTIAAKPYDNDRISNELFLRMARIKESFAGFRYLSGYNHNELDKLLDPVTLGVVPPLWEDNLPQVALEFVAHGVPILTSNRGGAREIAKSPDFVFDVSNQDSLARKIVEIVEGKLEVGKFWQGQIRLTTNEGHVEEVLAHYYSSLEKRRQEADTGG